MFENFENLDFSEILNFFGKKFDIFEKFETFEGFFFCLMMLIMLMMMLMMIVFSSGL